MVADNAELRFLDSLSEGQVADLTALGRSRRHAVGDRLFNEREPGDAVLVLLSGRVKLSCVTEGGREAVIRALRTLRELGWIATRRRGITLLDVEMLRRRAV